MNLLEIAIPTGIARSGMSVADVFRECIAHNVPGLPFCNAQDEVVGRISIRDTLKKTCIPEHVIKAAQYLGDHADSTQISEANVSRLLGMPVEPFILDTFATVSSVSTALKALAIMERQNSSYVFLVDGHEYRGVVTRMGIAALVLRSNGAPGNPGAER